MKGVGEAGSWLGVSSTLARRFRGCTGKMMPISTPGDVLNDGSNLILRY